MDRDVTIYDVHGGISILDDIEDLDAAAAVSLSQRAEASQRSFYAQFELPCFCTPRELREERDGSIECARCAAKLRLRRRA